MLVSERVITNVTIEGLLAVAVLYASLPIEVDLRVDVCVKG